MHKPIGMARVARALGIGILVCSLTLGIGSLAAAEEAPTDAASQPAATPAATPTATPTATPAESTPSAGGKTAAPAALSAPQASSTAVNGGYGSVYPVATEATFARPVRSISSKANSDFTLLDDMERLIRGTWRDQNTGNTLSAAIRKNNYVFISVSRMENSYRVGRALVEAAGKGVKVRFIHGKASQSKESRALQKKLNAKKYGASAFKICAKGKSLACLATGNGAIMHSKILLINNSYTRSGAKAKGIVWTGSANLGGPSGERTYNNALTVYNERTFFNQMGKLWNDMWAERNIGNDYLAWVKRHASSYYGAKYGMFYSAKAKTTLYETPIKATPTNGKDPVVAALNRVIPGEDCRIRVMHNRFKYRRLYVAHQLQELASKGCEVSAIAFRDDLKVNRAAHCQLYIRICQPILDEFRKASDRIEVAWAKPHDKTMLIEAHMRKNKLNPAETTPDGAYVKFVQAGSAALTGSNLVVSDEVTTETTDEQIYEDYLQHWKAIWKSHEFRGYKY